MRDSNRKYHKAAEDNIPDENEKLQSGMGSQGAEDARQGSGHYTPVCDRPDNEADSASGEPIDTGS